MSMNIGHFSKDRYTKFVNFSRAVLWMTKELSVQTFVMNHIKEDRLPIMEFIDQRKKEIWKFKTEDVIKFGREKAVGQESQWYFPIKFAQVIKYEDK